MNVDELHGRYVHTDSNLASYTIYTFYIGIDPVAKVIGMLMFLNPIESLSVLPAWF